MQAYEEGLKPGDTRLLLKPDTSFFRYFNSPSGKLPGDGEQGAMPPAGTAAPRAPGAPSASR
jgi:membrane protease subunit HflC